MYHILRLAARPAGNSHSGPVTQISDSHLTPRMLATQARKPKKHMLGLTKWGLDVRNVGVVGHFPREQTDPRWATYCSGTEVFLEVRTFLSKLLLEYWLVVKRV